MINIAISLAVYAAMVLVLQLLAGLDVWLAVLIGLVAFAGTYFLLSRRIAKKLSAAMEVVQRDMQAGRAEKAIKTLESLLPLGRWQIMIASQVNAQIGSLYYLKRDFSHAFEYLKKGFSRHWPAMGMLAICYMKRNKRQEMIQTFDKAVAVNRKEPLLWNLYAYCLEKVGERDKAIAVLQKALKKTGGDERLQDNLDALCNGRKMKMKTYGDAWYQFHLEKAGAIIKQQTKAMQGRRKMVRR